MKRFSSTLTVGLITAFLAQGALAATSAPVATVNGTAIPASRAQLLIDEQTARGTPESPQLKDAIKEQLIRLEVISQAATKKNLAKKPEVITQLDLAKQGILVRAYLEDYLKTNPVSDADIQAEYNQIKERLGSEEFKARHILVETEDEAKAIIEKLKGGAKFEDLAKASKDPGTREKGGELGWSNPSMFVKPFSDAMVKLQKGQFTQAPVKTDFGYHVILLEDVRPLEAPPLDEVKPQLVQRLQQQKIEAHVNELREKAKVE